MSDMHITAPEGLFLQPWQQRLLEEKADLGRRLEALQKFCDSPAFWQLPEEDRKLLSLQESQMAALSQTLGRRIARFA